VIEPACSPSEFRVGRLLRSSTLTKVSSRAHNGTYRNLAPQTFRNEAETTREMGLIRSGAPGVGVIPGIASIQTRARWEKQARTPRHSARNMPKRSVSSSF
jgi:hypothetical protein